MLESARFLAEMKRNQWLRPAALEDACEKKFLSLVRYARENVPFYRKRFEGASVRSLDDAALLKPTNKTDVRDNARSFISRQFSPEALGQMFTSGSTGIQVPLFHTVSESAFGVAFEAHQLTECGASLFSLQARIAHYESRPNLLQRLGVFRCRYLPVQADDAANMASLLRMRPGILISYPSILLPLARINRSGGHGLRLRIALSGGETLTRSARKEISSSFSCPVYDRYGSMESSWVAWECKSGGLHVQQDQVFLEILGRDGKHVPEGKEGSIHVTPLWRRAMPFIRYGLGDSASWAGPCECGRGLRTLRLIHGREDDMIVLPSGKERSARSINLMDDIQGIIAYQIVQERPDLFVFRFVKGGDFGNKQRNEVARRISHGCLGEKVTVEFEEMQSIRRGPTGKIRAVISKAAKHSPGNAR